MGQREHTRAMLERWRDDQTTTPAASPQDAAAKTEGSS